MKNKIIFVICIFFIIVLGVLAGNYLYKYNTSGEKISSTNNLQENIIENKIRISDTIQTSTSKVKTTPNTLMIFKTYYTKCKHYINSYEDIDASAVNLTQEEIKEKYKGWKIEQFSEEQILLEREEEDYCNEHYKLKLEDGKVYIYIIDSNNNVTKWKDTEITSEFLTEEDILRLKEGITVYGKENLSSVLEDYE